MKVRMRIGISGITSGGGGKSYDSLTRGQVVDVDEAVGRQWCQNGYAETTLTGPVGPARKPAS